MDIVSRLKSFLQQSGIGISQFADNCEIPRPTLSQLLNGRNKKVSDELISKIHRAYPALNIMWLLFGDGSMFVPNEKFGASDDDSQPSESVVVNQPSGNRPTIDFSGADDFRTSKGNKSTPQVEQSMSAALQHMAKMTSASRTPRGVSSRENAQSRVVSIMVFYSDGRFETFAPQ